MPLGLDKPDSRTINVLAMSPFDYEWLLTKFAFPYREKLRMYTGQELYYVYKICTYKPKDKASLQSFDLFILQLKAKTMRWLKGMDRFGVHPGGLEKIGKRWSGDYEEYIELEVA